MVDRDHGAEARPRPLAEGMQMVRGLLDRVWPEFPFPDHREVSSMVHETFLSGDLERWSVGKDEAPQPDRSLTIIVFADDSQTIITSGKVAETPFSIWQDGLDLRSVRTAAYECTTDGLILERSPDGTEERYEGYSPDDLLAAARQKLGTRVGATAFAGA